MPLCYNAPMQIQPIAHICNDYKEKFGIPRQSGLSDGISQIIFEPEFRDANALRGMEGFSHLWLIWGFSESGTDATFRPTVRPPRLGGDVRMGVFATRSPFRPNRLGLSSVRISTIRNTEEGPVIEVIGADLLDGTPIYDIKPYLRQFDCHADATEGFVGQNDYETLTVSIAQELLEKIPEEKRRPLIQALEQDPRPHYQDDSNRMYGMHYADMDVKFKVEDHTLTVLDIK